MPKIFDQEGVEVVKSILHERIFEQIFERSEVIDVPQISHMSRQPNIFLGSEVL